MARSLPRLVVLAVLVASMIAVLLGRTVQLQAGAGQEYTRAAEGNRIRELVDPAVRGLILDQAGRPLVANRQILRVVADRGTLYALPQDGADVVSAVAAMVGSTFADLDAKLTFCSSPRAVPGQCWAGGAGQPIPVADDVPLEQVLPVIEQPERFPGFRVDTVTARTHPARAGERAAQLLGRLGAVTPEELASGTGGFRADDLVGRGGLEQQYDQQLRGTPGARTVAVDKAGQITQTLSQQPAVNGSTLVTSIDARLQAVVEQQLAAAVERARSAAGAALPADSGSAVVVDVTNGHVLAMASYPDYDPAVFDGGISDQEYAALRDSGALLFNPVQGTYAPGSTFKPFTVAAMAAAGYDLGGSYPCPSSYTAGGRSFANHESRGYGTISLQRALEVSCNTVFYRVADQIWGANGGQGAGPTAGDPISEAAAAFGLGQLTGIDLPGEAAGMVFGRSAKDRQWQQQRDKWCAAAAAGYPELRAKDPGLADAYTALDRENCESGGLWREGDAINASIGQGDTAVTPLQLAMAYAAIANGGTRYRPQLAKALVAPDGSTSVVAPEVVGDLPVSQETLRFLDTAMVGVTRDGTAAQAFAGFPLDRIPIAGKTGSAQVSGKQATSWFASFAPADRPRYAVVMMVTQGGTGAGTSAPSVRGIYEALFGVAGGTVDPARSVLSGGAPTEGLPPLDGTAGAPAAPGPAEPARGEGP